MQFSAQFLSGFKKLKNLHTCQVTRMESFDNSILQTDQYFSM